MTILNDYPVLPRNLDLLLAFHRLAPLLSVDQLAEIDLVFKYHSDRSNVPVELPSPIIRFEVVGIMEIEVSYRREDFFLAEDFRGPIEADTLRCHSEYPSHRLSGRLIYHKMMPVVRVQLVTEGRL